MADQPPAKRAAPMPPPIPRLPAMLTGHTEVVALVVPPETIESQAVPTANEGQRSVEDITSSLVAVSDAVLLIRHVLELVASDATALLGEDAPDRLADLNVRTALASWDVLHRPDEAIRLLELADGHPLAPRLRAMAALDDRAALARLTDELLARPAFERELALELAEAWLWRHGDARRASDLADRLLAAITAADTMSPWHVHVLELAVVAHGARANWPRVVELCRTSVSDRSPPEDIAATAALLLDRGGDPAAALATCWSKLAYYRTPRENLEQGRDARAIGWLRCLDVALDAAIALDDERRFELLDRRAELIGELPGGELESLATRLALANESGDSALWLELASSPTAQDRGGLARYARLRATWTKAPTPEAQRRKLAAHRLLADVECAEVAATHAWRSLELAALTDEPTLGDLARTVVDAATSRAAERWLDVVDVAAPTAHTGARFELRGGLALRWAAAIAERAGAGAALVLWRRAAAAPDALPTTTDHLARLHRRGDHHDELAAAYRAWLAQTSDDRSAAALWSARGIVELVRGDFVEAEDALRKAAELAPGDPFCRASLAAVFRASHRRDQLAQMLAELAMCLASKEARGAAAREYAELLDQLGHPARDFAGAEAALEQLVADHPDDAEPMLALAKLYDRAQRWADSIALRRRALDRAKPEAGAEIWAEIARAEERRGDRDAALAALARAAEAGYADALRDQARILHAAGDRDAALAIVRRELADDPPLDRRMQLQRHLAQLLTELDREPEAIVAAYLDVLSIEPDQTEALAGLEPPARKLGLWDELARAFRGAPQTPRNLEVLAEALGHIAEWSELAEVRRRQLEAATTNVARAQRAAELAALYEHELGDLDAAIRALALAQQHLFDDERQDALRRLLRDAARWSELALALERAVPHVRNSDRHVATLLELAALRAEQLARPSDAVEAYEAVLARQPDEPTASAALEKLYDQLGRDQELARLLEARAARETGPTRGEMLARVAALRNQRGDVAGAIATYAAAFDADPTNRDVFTTMERVCYKAERWADAMQLYDRAIAYLEAGGARAYRLGDLYARRGNVQLNFLNQVDAALASYQKVVEVDSQPEAAVKILEDLCRRRGDWQPLITAYERRAETQRDSQRKIEALRAAAALAVDHVDAGESMRINRKMLDVDPHDLGAASSLERFYEDNQDRSGLIQVLKVRLAHEDNQAASVDLLRRIARVSEDGARDVVTATEHYQKILELEPENRDALEALGRIYESTEQWAELIDVTRRLIRVTHDRTTKALLYFRCGSVMEAKFGREQDAIRYYDAAIKTSSACLPAVHGLRDLYRRRAEWPRVIETLELEVKLWQDDKERAGVFAQIGLIYDAQLADGERAMQFYESALAVDPECLPANQAMFEHLFAERAWDKAAPIANALAQKAMREGDPSTRSEFYRKRGVVAQHTGDPRNAAESFIVALEIKPTNLEALDDLGRLARERPDVWEFDATYRELEKVYKKRDDAGPLLARVFVGRATIRERDGDLDQAAQLYRQALDLAPGDFTVLSAMVAFHADMRHWAEALAALQQFVTSAAASPADRLAALMRQAELHADGELDGARAIAVLRQVIDAEPTHQDAYYTLAQQHYLAGRYGEARAAIDRVIELATAPGQPLTAEALARYYYYKGRILDAAGDPRAAAPQYRRATEYDPGYAPPALVLARRAAEGGDQRQAETLLIEAAHAAMEHGGVRAAVPLQRGLARILLASGDRPAAIEAYRGILNVVPDGASDRVALAEIYAVDDPARALGELRKVLDRDIHHAPAYRLLASFYNRTGESERANRVLTALDSLGFAEDADRATMQRLQATRVATPLRHPLTDDARARLLVTSAAREPLGEVFAAIAPKLAGLVSAPSLGANLVPLISIGEPRLAAIAAELASMFAVDGRGLPSAGSAAEWQRGVVDGATQAFDSASGGVEIFVGDQVPGLAAVTAYPRRMLAIDRSLLTEPEPSLRFLFGYAFEAIRGGYAALLQLGARQRRELGNLLRALLSTDEPTGSAAELLGNLDDRGQQVIERHAGLRDVDPGAWIDRMAASAKRAGLLACDDFHAAIWMVALLAGEKLASHHATVALGAVLGGADLVRFFLSDAYQQLRELMTS